MDRLRHSLIEVFDETSRKRAAPSEPIDGLSDAKRQRLGAEIPSAVATPPQAAFPRLPPGPVSYAQLYTLTNDQGAKGFDVKAIPLDLIIRLIPPLLSSIDQGRFDTAINVCCALSIRCCRVTSYLASLQNKPSPVQSCSNIVWSPTRVHASPPLHQYSSLSIVMLTQNF